MDDRVLISLQKLLRWPVTQISHGVGSPGLMHTRQHARTYLHTVLLVTGAGGDLIGSRSEVSRSLVDGNSLVAVLPAGVFSLF